MSAVRTRANQAIKKGDLVKVISGKEKGKTGKVLRILSAKDRVVIENLNMIKRHTKPTASNRQGGIVQEEGSIHLSNVASVGEAPKVTKATPKAKMAVASKKKKEAKAV